MKKQTQQNDNDQHITQEPVIPVDEKHEGDMWKEKYLRVLADYQNLEKRTEEERREIRMFAGIVILEKLLPVVDLLETAQEHLKDQGLELALKELTVVFYSLGVEKIEVMGKIFDPYSMDCIEIVESGEEDVVVSVVCPGYRMHGKMIRPAKVKVGKKLEKEEGINNSINE